MIFGLTIVLHSFLLGSLVFFITIITPSVFKTLNNEFSSKFLRLVFPRVFVYGFFVSMLCSITSYFENLTLSLYLSIFMSFTFLINAYVITPIINKMRDLSNKGNNIAKNKFKFYHFLSVFIYLIQILISIIIITYYFI